MNTLCTSSLNFLKNEGSAHNNRESEHELLFIVEVYFFEYSNDICWSLSCK